jgi:hypothetical protein
VIDGLRLVEGHDCLRENVKAFLLLKLMAVALAINHVPSENTDSFVACD